MKITNPPGGGSAPSHRPLLYLLLLALALPATATAQLTGVYRVGSGGDFATLAAAISALTTSGVTGEVTLLLQAGTHTAPATGFVIRSINGTSATARVSLRPDAGADVVITGSSAPALIDLNGGRYVTIIGVDSAGGGSLTLVNSATNGCVVRLINGATENALERLRLVGSGSTSSYATVRIEGTNTGVGNSGNVVRDCVVGDTAGVSRAAAAIAMTGSSTAPNRRTLIQGNELVNPGRATGTAYGMSIGGGNDSIVIRGNRIHATTASGTESTGSLYAIYLNNGASRGDTVENNRIHSLAPLSGSSHYGIYVADQGSAPTVVRGNMIALASSSGTVAGIYTTEPDPLIIEQNSVWIGGTASGSGSSHALYSSGGAALELRNNILTNVRRSTTTNGNRVLSITTAPSSLASEANILGNGGGSGNVFASYIGSVLAGMEQWQASSGKDSLSLAFIPPFIDPGAGNLHIAAEPVFAGESRGIGSPGGADLDGDVRRDRPDIGADEGEHNGGGIVLTSSGDSVRLRKGCPFTLHLSTSRPIAVVVELEQSGVWRQIDSLDADGPTTVQSLMPTDALAGRLRCRSLTNVWEGDTTEGIVVPVDPQLTARITRGGGEMKEGDTLEALLEWEIEGDGLEVELGWRIGDGPWNAIDTLRLDSTRSASPTFVVPALTDTLSLRFRALCGSALAELPAVAIPDDGVGIELLHPRPGELLVGGDLDSIVWRARGLETIRIDYSLDSGSTWKSLARRVAAFATPLRFIVPNKERRFVAIRLSGLPDTSIVAESGPTLGIILPELEITEPKGREGLEPGEALRLAWSSRVTDSVRVEYSAGIDDGWITLVPAVAASIGEVTVTPPPIPTKRGRIRIIDVARPHVVDRSGRIAILPPRVVTLLSPAAGDRLRAGAMSWIEWEAPRCERITVDISIDGGERWETLADDLPAINGGALLRLPELATAGARIRLRDPDTGLVTQSGSFTIEQTSSLGRDAEEEKSGAGEGKGGAKSPRDGSIR